MSRVSDVSFLPLIPLFLEPLQRVDGAFHQLFAGARSPAGSFLEASVLQTQRGADRPCPCSHGARGQMGRGSFNKNTKERLSI